MIKEKIEIEADDGALDKAADAAERLGDALDKAAGAADKANDAIKKTEMPAGPKAAPAGASAPSAGTTTGGASLPSVGGAKAPRAKKSAPADEAGDTAAKKTFGDIANSDEINKEIEKQRKEKLRKAQKDAAEEKQRQRKADQVRKQVTKDSINNLKSIGKGIGVVGAFALTAATTGIAALYKGLKEIGEVKIKRDNIRNALDQVTRGRGAQAFQKLDALARGLGKTTEEVADQFVAFRKRGIDNVNASKLIKLRADLEAVGVSADRVDAAVGSAADQIQRTGNADAAIAGIAKRYGAVGDGSNAAAKSAYTVEGAFDRAQRAIDDTVGVLADELGPAITDVVNSFLSGFGDIDKNTKGDAIRHLKDDIKALAPAAKSAAHAIGTFLDIFNAVSDFLTGKGLAFNALRDTVHDVEDAFSNLGQEASDTWTGIKTAVSNGVNDAIDAVKGFVSDFEQAGADLINGFIDGIKGAAQGVKDAVLGIGQDSVHSLRHGIDAHSPSRATMKAGNDFGEGFRIGAERSMPDGRDLAPDALDTAYAANDNGRAWGKAAPTPAGRGAVGAGVYIAKIESHIHVQSNASPEQIASADAAAIEGMLRRVGAA